MLCALLLQLIALMGVRKLMDFIFSPIEMYWLDHMLPGEERIKREDEQVNIVSESMQNCVHLWNIFLIICH